MLHGLLVLAASLTGAGDPVAEASPFVGTDGHGHAFPGATAPFGMVQLSPDTRTDTWDGCSGYHYSDSRILGFSHTHLSGTGVGGLGDIMLMPYVGTVEGKPNVSSAFDHKDEKASPGAYSVFLKDPKATVELTATPRAGMHRIRFQDGGSGQNRFLVLDLNHGIQNETIATSLKVEDASTLSGWRRSNGWGGQRTAYFVMRFSKPLRAVGIEGSTITPLRLGESSEGKIRAFLNLPDAEITIKVGISATGIEGARNNLDAEIPGWDFDTVRNAAQDQWRKTLGATTIEAKDAKIRRTFYSNLYLSYQAPNLFDDVDGRYFGTDKHLRSGLLQDGRILHNYTTFSLWDTYRSLHPLLALVQPDRVDDMMTSLTRMYSEAQPMSPNRKTTPIWPLWGNETYTMVGVSSIPVVCEAYVKGYRGFNADEAYRQMRETMLGAYRGLDTFNELGYVASKRGDEAASKTVEYSYDAWCLARMAEAMGKPEDAAMFYAKSQNYRNLFDRSKMLVRGRKADGSWRRPFDTFGLVGDEYTEADAWQYTLGAPHDVDGMAALYGGDKGFICHLDTMFTMTDEVHTGIPDITGRIGQYAHGNEPCQHVAYLYGYVGAPAKAAQRVRQVMATMYDDTPSGQIGNVDCGQTAAWYVWSAMGLYPVNASSGILMIGSPVGDRVTMRIPSNAPSSSPLALNVEKPIPAKTFAVEAIGNSPKNLYVQSATLNGKPWDKCYVTDAQVRAGGTLRLVMGPRPSRWATAKTARPPSTMPKGFRYAPLPAPAAEDQVVVLSLPIRVISGGDDPIEGWIPDPNGFEGSTNGTRGRIDVSAPDAGPEAIYLTERYGKDFTQRFTVPKGSYTVRLHFAEVFGDTPGQRVETVSINGKRVLENFDPIVAAGGPMRAVVKTFADIRPNAKGEIVIRVQAVPGAPDQNAKISAIEIIPAPAR